MLEQEALGYFIDTARDEIVNYLYKIPKEDLNAAAQLILGVRNDKNRVHVTGIGKPGHLAGYASSLMSSTGIPTYFLHGTEAVHGSSGQTVPGDVVICISNSGGTEELKRTMQTLIDNRCLIVGVTGNKASWVAQHSDVHIFAGVNEEGGPLGRAPRLSIIAETLALQALSIILQAELGITPEQYVCWHPNGALGKL